MSDKPTGKVKVRMYDVEFGDCFLLSFDYKDSRDRHVMIDAGSKGTATKALKKAVTDLASDCGGKLDAMVFTHRHSDHIKGLGLEDTAKTLVKLNPDVILLPWTEDPGAAPDTKQPNPAYTKDDREYLAELAAGQAFAEVLEEHADVFRSYGYETGMYNKAALSRLLQLQPKCRYVSAADKDVLGDVLPGVKVTVLGPPTLSRWPQLREDEQSKYWKHYHSLAAVKAGLRSLRAAQPPIARAMDPDHAPSSARWFIDRLEHDEADNAMRLVTTLNGVLNNTSLVLLFQVKKTKLLFAGDAEHALWDFVLRTKAGRKRVANISLYKVSHHGSGNGTPKKQFWENLENLSPDPETPQRLVTLLSGEKVKSWPSIPASTLRTALKKQSDMMSTYAADKQKKPWVRDLP